MNERTSLELSLQLNIQMGEVPTNLTNHFCTGLQLEVLADEEISVPQGASVVPIGPVPGGSLGFLYIENQDPALVVQVSTNSNGSAPFAQIRAGQALALPAVSGQSYYFNVPSGPLTARVVALSN